MTTHEFTTILAEFSTTPTKILSVFFGWKNILVEKGQQLRPSAVGRCRACARRRRRSGRGLRRRGAGLDLLLLRLSRRYPGRLGLPHLGSAEVERSVIVSSGGGSGDQQDLLRMGEINTNVSQHKRDSGCSRFTDLLTRLGVACVL